MLSGYKSHEQIAEMCFPIADLEGANSDGSSLVDGSLLSSKNAVGTTVGVTPAIDGIRDSYRFKTSVNTHLSDLPSEFISQKLISQRNSQPDLWLILNKWIGYVHSIDSETGEFTAVLQDLTNPSNPQEIAIFPIDDVSESDLEIFTEGATFTWNVGYSINNKSKVRGAVMRFSRYKGASEKEVNRAKLASKQFDDLFE